MNCDNCSMELNDDSKCTSCPADATHCKNCHKDGGEAGGGEAGGSEDTK